MDGAPSRPHKRYPGYWEPNPPPPNPPFGLSSRRDLREQQRLKIQTGGDETRVQNPDFEPSRFPVHRNYDTDPGTRALTIQEEKENQLRLQMLLGEDDSTFLPGSGASPFPAQGNSDTDPDLDPDPGPSPSTRALTIEEESRNQHRLQMKPGEDDTTVPDPDFGSSPFPGQGNSDPDFAKALSPMLRSMMESRVRQTSDRNPGGSNLDSARLKKNNPKSLIGPSHQPAESHGREQVTDHGRNLGSGRRHTKRQNASPTQPAAGSKARKWEYVRHHMGRVTKFEYEYDQSGRLVTDGGFKATKIEIYLCNHDLFKGSSNIKDCGLTLWIQRAPRTADYRGDAAESLCLFESCSVSKDRYISAGDVRVAFDESPARSPEYDPQTNAGYIHLKCLESHQPHNHRQMFAALNFKVEGREPQPNDSLHRNPTTFGTIQEIVYIEDYLEQCRKEGEANPDGKATGSGPLLSISIEKQTQGQSKRARDIQRKLLELNGFHNLESSLLKKYAELGGPAETVSTIQGRSSVINPKAIDTRQHKKKEQAQRADSRQVDDLFDDDEYQPGGNQEYDEHDGMPVDPYHPKITESMRRRPVAPPTPPVPDPTKESRRHPPKKQPNQPLPSKAPKSKGKDRHKEKIIVPPYEGRGKWKKRMRLNARNQEVWEAYEDPWSPLQSGDDPESSKRTRTSKKEKKQGKASAAGARNDGQRKNKRRRVDQNDGEGGDNVKEAEGEDEGRDEGRAESRDEGRDEGRDKGRDEGRDEGRNEGGDEGRDEGRDEGGDEGKDEGRYEDGDEDRYEDGDEGEDGSEDEYEEEIEKEIQEDHQTKKRRRK